MNKTDLDRSTHRPFSERLQSLIDDPDSGILLDANAIWNKRQREKQASAESAAETHRAAFELASGRFQRKFVTLWELFDHPEEFEACLDELTEVALKLREGKRYFSTIATSSATARHLMEHLHARIEDDQDPVNVKYLGHYPFLNADDSTLFDFQNEKVLILTDIVASGTLVSRLAAAIEQLGGTVVGALTVLRLTEEDHTPGVVAGTNRDCSDASSHEILAQVMADAKQELESGESVRVNSGDREQGSEHRVKLFPLLDYICPRLDTGTFDRDKVVSIDPQTVYPVERRVEVERIVPKVEPEDVIDFFEQAHAIDFGFFLDGSSRFTHAVRTKRLLETGTGIRRIANSDATAEYQGVGQLLWQTLEGLFEDRSWKIVTSFSRPDYDFRRFIEKQLSSAEKYHLRAEDLAYLFRRDEGSEDDDYFIPEQRLDRVRGQKVILLVGIVHSGDRLRKLASLLASYGVSELRVVCLVNCMGILTEDFISRIKTLLRGVNGSESLDPEVRFEFAPVITIDDLPTERANRVHSGVLSLLDQYARRTTVPSFQRWVSQSRKYFIPSSVTSRAFDTDSLYELNEPLDLTYQGTPVTVHYRETKLFVILSNILRGEHRDYSPLISELVLEDDKATLYKIYSLLLGDISFLRMTGQYLDIRNTLLNRLQNTRRSRMLIEEEANQAGRPVSEVEIEKIRDKIDLETHLLFGLALFSYLDRQTPESEHQELIIDLITSGLSPERWSDYRENVLWYLSDERIAWCVSMLIQFTHPRIIECNPDDSTAIQSQFGFKTKLKRIISTYTEEFKHRFKQDVSNSVAERMLRAKQNFDSLMLDLGFLSQEKKHHVIRFLHGQLLGPKQHHNPISTTLNSLLTELGLAVYRGRAQSRIDIRKLSRGQLLQQRLEDAIYTTGILQTITHSAQVFFIFASTNVSNVKQYTSDMNDQSSLVNRIKAFGDLLERVRVSNLISEEYYDRISKYIHQIRNSLFTTTSPLVKTLTGFICPLDKMLNSAFNGANTSLSKYGLKNCWLDAWRPVKPELNNLEIWRKQLIPETESEYEEIKIGMISETESLVCLFDRHGLRELLRNILGNGRHAWLPEGVKVADPKIDCAGKSDFAMRIVQEPAPDEETGYLEFIELKFITIGTPITDNWADNGNGMLVRQRLAVEEYGGSLTATPLKENTGTQFTLKLISRRELHYRNGQIEGKE